MDKKERGRKAQASSPAVDKVTVSEEKTNCSNSKNIKPWEIQNVQRAGCSSFLSVDVIKISEKKQLGR